MGIRAMKTTVAITAAVLALTGCTGGTGQQQFFDFNTRGRSYTGLQGAKEQLFVIIKFL